MRPDFQCDPTAGHGAEDFPQCFRIRPDSLLQPYLAGFIHHAIPTVAISQIQSNGQFLLRNIPALRCCSGANLLHCRSPFYLCFEHVDNLGAYTASRRETGLLIPSAFNSYHPLDERTSKIRLRRNGAGNGQGAQREIAEEFLSKCESTMKLNVKAGLVFAALGFAIVVAIGVLYLNLNASPSIWLLRLAPATIVFATEDPGWTALLVVVAPLNAALYGGIAFAVTSALRYFLQRHRGASSAR
jgi:hypothetical protein